MALVSTWIDVTFLYDGGRRRRPRPAYLAGFAKSFAYRPWLKAAGLVSSGVLVLFLLAYALRAVERISAVLSDE